MKGDQRLFSTVMTAIEQDISMRLWEKEDELSLPFSFWFAIGEIIR